MWKQLRGGKLKKNQNQPKNYIYFPVKYVASNRNISSKILLK